VSIPHRHIRFPEGRRCWSLACWRWPADISMPTPGSFIGPLPMRGLPIWCFYVTGGALRRRLPDGSFL